MTEQVTTSASTLAPDTLELMSSPNFSETVMHAERVHPVAWAGPVSEAVTLPLKMIVLRLCPPQTR